LGRLMVGEKMSTKVRGGGVGGGFEDADVDVEDEDEEVVLEDDLEESE